MFWNAVTAFATSIYTVLVAVTFYFIWRQLKEMNSTRKREATLVVFRELQAREARDARRYIYTTVPMEIEGIGDDELQTHLERSEEALVSLDRVGFLVGEEHVDSDPLMETVWAMVWRCWRKSEVLIRWTRGKRNDPTYLNRFEYLFEVSEEFRLINGYEEPQIY